MCVKESSLKMYELRSAKGVISINAFMGSWMSITEVGF